MVSVDFNQIGMHWALERVEELPEKIDKLLPSDYNEQTRYLPESVTSKPGYIRYDVNPYMREIVDCFSVNSPVREVNVKKGVQITYSTLLESGVLYYADYIGTLPIMYMTADKELANARIENNFIPMFNHSDKAHIIQSHDLSSAKKTGKTKAHIQFAKGGYLVPFGAKNADKMRSFSIAIMLKDEIDAWPEVVGKDGDPDKLSDARTDGYTEVCKIFRGSTPLIKSTSKIQKNFLRGDQRIYRVLCRSCSYPQELRWNTVDKETGIEGGFHWEMDDGTLVLESVHYSCQKCGHKHYEHDKEWLFAEKNGAHWHPTAKPVDPYIRSYHLPALYSPFGMRPWWKCVADYIEAYDVKAKKFLDLGKYQVFYNNILAEPFEPFGSRIVRDQVSMHRRMIYKFGEIPNEYAQEYSGSKILFLTCQVDVHKNDISVAVMGWCKHLRCYLIDYWVFDKEDGDADCSEISSKVWLKLRELIEEKVYDGKYRILMTLIDSGYANDTVCTFANDYFSGVYPIVGRSTTSKLQSIKEFAEFKTQIGTIGYRIYVDHYKDRLAPILRREWTEDYGEQKPYHFNAPVDITNAQLDQFTVEYRSQKKDDRGVVSYYWHRPGNADNTLWDLLVYGHAAVEIIAYQICIQYFELDTVDWHEFWQFAESVDNDKIFGRITSI